MPSNKHEVAIEFAILKLGGQWSRRGFRRSLVRLFGGEAPAQGWIPDAWRANKKTREIAVIESGLNQDDKWSRICEYWWAIDSSDWSLTIHLIDYETLKINTLSDSDVAAMVYCRAARCDAKTKPSSNRRGYREWCDVVGVNPIQVS